MWDRFIEIAADFGVHVFEDFDNCGENTAACTDK